MGRLPSGFVDFQGSITLYLTWILMRTDFPVLVCNLDCKQIYSSIVLKTCLCIWVDLRLKILQMKLIGFKFFLQLV